ncbi:hypothetical protein G3R49_13910 [Shewanella sp. WXL01]|uniref:hypothetical protein n=1 Tax=Shewanella sp. WXL01 TaxID=2709721 RepID=UPI0014382901|nr:hypothetical protein [Shewanella sp. WXL01]NKF51656.1 hypothetical protein [Shewanella sp. WXL01]
MPNHRSAILRAVFYPYICLLAFYLVVSALEDSSNFTLQLIVNPFFIYFYALASLAGWWLIGYPTFKFSESFFNGNKVVYFAVLLLIFLIITGLGSANIAAFYCAIMLVQILFFLFFMRVKKT